MNRLFQRCQPISIIALRLSVFLTLLGACASQAPVPAVAPYHQELRQLELQAINSLQLGNYTQARRLYQRALDAYSAIDDTGGMARQLVNMTQISLILFDQQKAQASLHQLALLGETNPGLRQRTLLLQANFLVQREQWQQAIDTLASINSDESDIVDAAAVTQALALYSMNGIDATSQVNLAQSDESLSRARLLRLKTQIALDQGRSAIAKKHLDAAMRIYRQVLFAPGIAEGLLLQARLAEQRGEQQLAGHLTQRAAKIFARIGSQREFAELHSK